MSQLERAAFLFTVKSLYRYIVHADYKMVNVNIFYMHYR